MPEHKIVFIQGKTLILGTGNLYDHEKYNNGPRAGGLQTSQDDILKTWRTKSPPAKVNIRKAKEYFADVDTMKRDFLVKHRHCFHGKGHGATLRKKKVSKSWIIQKGFCPGCKDSQIFLINLRPVK